MPAERTSSPPALTAAHPALAPERLAPPTPGQLRKLLSAERLRPRRALSQNFLTDAEALDAIVAAADLHPGERVVEVGPGLGVLTRRLLAAGCRVLAVELDARLAAYLRAELASVPGFDLVEADALALHAREIFPGESFKLVASIPYHITSPLLHAFLEGERPPEVTVMAPDQIETISDATDLLVDQQDVTPMGLAYQAIELQTSDDALDAALRRVLRAMKV